MIRTLLISFCLLTSFAHATPQNYNFEQERYAKAENHIKALKYKITTHILKEKPANYAIIDDNRGITTKRERITPTGNKLLTSTTFAVDHPRGRFVATVGETCGGTPVTHIAPYGQFNEAPMPRGAVSLTKKYDRLSKNNHCYGIHKVVHGVSGKNERQMGAGIYGVVTKDSKHYYAGARVKQSDKYHFNHREKSVTRAELAVGVERKYKTMRVGLELTKALTKEYDFEGRSRLPVKIMARASWTF